MEEGAGGEREREKMKEGGRIVNLGGNILQEKSRWGCVKGIMGDAQAEKKRVMAVFSFQFNELLIAVRLTRTHKKLC